MASNTEFSDSSCGRNGDSRILLTYATQFGTTREVAEVIAKVLREAGATVDIKWVKNVDDLTSYDAVIIGSAIQYDRWMPEARTFVTAHQNALSQLSVAYFFTCLTLSSRSEKAKRQAQGYSNKLYALAPQVNPLSIGQFAGVLDYSKLSPVFRFFAKGLFAFLGVKEGDYRDWDAIHNWAKNAHSKFNLRISENKG